MGRIPAPLQNNIKSDKELTLICQQPQEADKPYTPWTQGNWVSKYQEIAYAIMEAPDGTNYINPSLIVNQYLNKNFEGVIVTSSKEGLL